MTTLNKSNVNNRRTRAIDDDPTPPLRFASNCPCQSKPLVAADSKKNATNHDTREKT